MTTGRVVGVLILLQMASSALVNGVLEAPLFGEPGFLVNVAPHAQQIGLAALLGLTAEALWVGIAIAVFSLFWRHSRTLALWLSPWPWCVSRWL